MTRRTAITGGPGAGKTTLWRSELARYEAVVFLEPAAAAGLSIADGNAVRSEDRWAVCAIDTRTGAEVATAEGRSVNSR